MVTEASARGGHRTRDDAQDVVDSGFRGAVVQHVIVGGANPAPAAAAPGIDVGGADEGRRGKVKRPHAFKGSLTRASGVFPPPPATIATYPRLRARRARPPRPQSLKQLLLPPLRRAAAMPAPTADADYCDRTDVQLLADHRAGDDAAFAEIVRRYTDLLDGFLRRRVGDRCTSEDLRQEVFLRVHRSAHRFDGRRPFRRWLFAIAVNLMTDCLRSRAKRRCQSLDAGVAHDGARGEADLEVCPLRDALPAPTSCPATTMEASESRHAVRELINALSPNMREILRLAYFEGLSYQEISVTLGVPLGTVKSRLHVATQNFARRWRVRHGETECEMGAPGRAAVA